MQRGFRLALPRAVLAGAGSVLLVVAGGYGSEGCRTATQVTVEIRTVGALPCTSLKGVAIAVARTPQDAEDRMRLGAISAEVPRGTCDADGRTLGTLVVTPSDSTGAIVVAARFSDDEKACLPPDYKGCIVARRSFSFIDHASVTLPISLEISCLDVPCGVVTSCRSGTCVGSDTQCSESSGACESAAEPVVLPDGGIEPVGDAPVDVTSPDADAGITDGPVDAPVDAPKDAPTDVNPVNYGNSCPTTPTPVDCNAQAQVCCYMGSYFCQTGCTPGYFVFNCQGRKYCNGGYCCGQPNGLGAMVGSSCDTTAGQFCAQSGSHYICTNDADCPPSRPVCTGTYYEAGTGVTRECRAL